MAHRTIFILIVIIVETLFTEYLVTDGTKFRMNSLMIA